MGGHPGRRAGAAGAVMGALLLAACGGLSREEIAAGQAAYLREADAVCERAREQIDGPQPRTGLSLAEAMPAAQEVVEGGGRALEAVRARRAETLPPGAQAFHDALPPVARAVAAAREANEIEDANATRKAARALEAAGGELLDVARRIGLDECGRGADRATDAILLPVFRDEFFAIAVDVTSRFEELEDELEAAETQEESLRAFERVDRIDGQTLRRLRRLGPPSDIEDLNRRFLGRFDAYLEVSVEVTEAFEAPAGSMSQAEIDALFERLNRTIERLVEAEADLRRELAGPQADAPPPDLDSA